MTQDLSPIFDAAAKQYGLDPDLLRAQARVESNFNPGAVSPQGAVGLMQLLPATAKSLGVDPTDATQSIYGAAALMRQNLDRYNGNLEQAVAAYHGGTDPANWGPKTANYVDQVAGTFGKLKQQGASPGAAVDPVTAALQQAPQMPSATTPSGTPGNQPQGAGQAAADPVAAALSRPQINLPPLTADPTDGMSTMEKFWAGAGKSVHDLGLGTGQLLRMGIEKIAPPQKTTADLVTGGPAHSFADTLGLPTQADIDESKRLDAPLMQTGAGVAGDIAGNVATTVLPLGWAARGAEAANLGRTALLARTLANPTTYAKAAVAGATLANLQPVASDESRGANTLIGAAAGPLGLGIANGVGRLATPVRNALDPVAQKAVDTLRSAGIPLDLAQATGSPFWSRVRSSLSDNIFTAGGQQAQREAQQQQFNSAVLKTMGATGTAATPDVMGGARDALNDTIGDVLSRNRVQMTPQSLGDLATTQGLASESEKGPVVSIINRITDAMDGNGQIDGQVAYGIKKDLDRMGSSADSDLAYFARQARGTLMDAMNGSLSGADQQAFSTARGQMANMFNIERAVDKTGTGNISPQRLAATMNTGRNRSISVYGNGPQDLADLAKAGAQILPDKLPNSGTTARMAMQLLPGLMTGAGTYAATGDPMEALKFGGGVIALPKLAQALLNSPASVNALTGGYAPNAVKSMAAALSRNKALAAALMRAPGSALGVQPQALPAPQQ